MIQKIVSLCTLSLIFFTSCTLSLLFFTSCAQSLPDGKDIQIEWEAISNTHRDDPVVKARFVIKNHSDFHFKDDNWALYYNQRPRSILSTDESARVDVEWINGDWHRIVPREGFQLRKNQETVIEYEARGWWIKESDAPMGLYFVFYDRHGNETGIVTADKIEIKPFTREEQISRHRNDATPIPTPEWSYHNNLAMHLIPESELKRVIPTPVRIQATGEYVTFTDPPEIYYEAGLENEADHLAGMLARRTGFLFNHREGPGPGSNSIVLKRRDLRINGVDREAYRLEIDKNRNITITGSDPSGVFYGIQTLNALLPVDGDSAPTFRVKTIEDAPRFPYRGMHIDVSRNFQQKETILKMLDLFAYYKINTLLLYLTEDEGWRIEIKALPELTDVGGQRGHTSMEAAAGHPAYGSGPFPYAEGSYGSGYYTHDEFIEILRYAHSRHIKIIPSVNLPAHARAAIKSMEARYERFMALGDEEAANEFRLIDPDETSEYISAQRFQDNVVNVARESVYHFFETVVDGILDIYEEAGVPVDIFHTGGDEVPEGVWTQSPMIDDLMETLPEINDPKNMQAWFYKRANNILRERNLKNGGWEEVVLLRQEGGTYTPNPEFVGQGVIPYIWNNLRTDQQDLGYRLANMGYPIVQCPVSNFYFDLAYNKDPKEPGLYWGGFINTKNAWYYAPFDIYRTTLTNAMGHDIHLDENSANLESLREDAKENILGLSAQLWSETILGPEMLEYYTLPKMIGFSESAWAAGRSFERITDRAEREQEASRKWNIFANTLARKELPRLATLYGGFHYRIPPPGAVIENRMLNANVEFPGLEIRYTTDGSEPSLRSTKYVSPVEVSGSVHLKAFDKTGRYSRTISINQNQ